MHLIRQMSLSPHPGLEEEAPQTHYLQRVGPCVVEDPWPCYVTCVPPPTPQSWAPFLWQCLPLPSDGQLSLVFCLSNVPSQRDYILTHAKVVMTGSFQSASSYSNPLYVFFTVKTMILLEESLPKCKGVVANGALAPDIEAEVFSHCGYLWILAHFITSLCLTCSLHSGGVIAGERIRTPST